MANDYEMAEREMDRMERQYDKAISVLEDKVIFLRATCDALYESHTKQCIDPEYCRTCIAMGEAFPDEYGIDND